MLQLPTFLGHVNQRKALPSLAKLNESTDSLAGFEYATLPTLFQVNEAVVKGLLRSPFA